MTERDRAARRRLVWLLLSRGDLGPEELRTVGLPALRPTGRQEAQGPPSRDERPGTAEPDVA
jgi:hypothetical protein